MEVFKTGKVFIRCNTVRVLDKLILLGFCLPLPLNYLSFLKIENFE